MAAAVLFAIVLKVITPHSGRLKFWWVFPVVELAALAAMRPRDVGLRPRLAVLAGRPRERRDRRQLGAVRQEPDVPLSLEHELAIGRVGR